MRRLAVVTAAAIGCLPGPLATAGVFLFAESQNNPILIAHPTGYSGTQNQLTISICIDPTSESRADMEIPLLNAIDTWNALEPVLNNLQSNSPQLSGSQIDYESVLLHEIGHCIGLGHPNLASESTLSGHDRRFAKSLRGPDGVYNLSAGVDGVIGTRDDQRGDDINLGWFRRGVNNPFLFESVIDGSTYSVDLEDLPAGHGFVEIGARQVAQLRGLPPSEPVMHQGIFTREIRRDLAPDDATMIRLGMAGRDRVQGTDRDYTYTLVYGGVTSGCNITVRTQGSGLGVCQVSGTFVPGTSNQHIQITSGTVTMGSAQNFNWFFNQQRRVISGIFSDRFETRD